MSGPSDQASKAKVLREVIRSYVYVLIWMGISIAVILFNKWLLAYSGFPFPIALTLWHMFFCSCVGVLAVRVLKVVKSHNMSSKEYMKRVMPIGGWGLGPCMPACWGLATSMAACAQGTCARTAPWILHQQPSPACMLPATHQKACH